MKKSILALAMGTFGLGMSEFGMMGVLTDVAKDIHLSIPVVGHMVSTYALGVAVGAPLIAMIARKVPLKTLLLILAAIYIIGNLIFTISQSYGFLILGRFISGFPHGAFFGAGSVVASKLADKGKVTSAVAGMVSGMTVANLIGVPFGTFLSHELGWRYTYAFITLFGFGIFGSIYHWVPTVPAMPNVGLLKQFNFLKSPAPWLILIATLLGNGGVFAWLSYIRPFMGHMAGYSPSSMSWIMMFAGFGMVMGNYISGKLSDAYSPSRIALVVEVGICLSLFILFIFSQNPLIALIAGFFCAAGLFGVSAPLQTLLLQNSKGGELLGAAGVQVAFNVGNALGAYLGGHVIDLGYAYNYITVPGFVLAFGGIIALWLFDRSYGGKSAVQG